MKLLLSLIIISRLIFNSRSDNIIIGKGQMPALSQDEKGQLHVVYGIGDSLLYSVSMDKGKSYSPPKLIQVIRGLAANASRGPQITTSKAGPVVIASTDAGNIWSFTKNIQGDWNYGKRLNDVDSINLEGFVDVASDGDGNLFAAWLDLRGNGLNKLYGAKSEDGGETWSHNFKIYESPDSTVCECCRVSVAMNRNNVYVMFRNQLFGQRDMHIISSVDGGRTFTQAKKLGLGTWKVNGCPMDGGALSLGRDGNVQTVWRRESKIYSCEPGKPEVEIGEGKGCTVEHVNGKSVFAWVKNGEVICKLPDNSIINLGKGNSPVLKAVSNSQVVCVWESENELYSTIIEL